MGSSSTDVSTWRLFLKRSLHGRLPRSKFESFAKLLYNQSPLRSIQLAEIFLTPKSSSDAVVVDPLLPIYVETLVNCGLVSASHVLKVLLDHSRLRSRDEAGGGDDDEHISSKEKKKKKKKKKKPCNSPELEEILLLVIARMFSTSTAHQHQQQQQQPRSPSEAFQILRELAAWMSAMVVMTGTRDEEMMILHHVSSSSASSDKSLALREAVGMLAVAVLGNQRIDAALLAPGGPRGNLFYNHLIFIVLGL